MRSPPCDAGRITRCLVAATCAILATLAAWSSAAAAEWHVAPRGNDRWSGSLAEPNADRTDGPFATLEHARDTIRAWRKAHAAEPVTVFVHGGEYPLTKTFTLSQDDSGTAAAPVVWRAYRDEKPVLIGGAVVRGWEPVADDAHTGGRLMKADLAAQGLGNAAFSQLVFAGRRQHLARWPNFDPANPSGGGWAYADGKIVPMYVDIEGEDKRSLVQKPADARTWARPGDGEVFVFPRYNWWNNIVRIRSFAAATRTITLAADCSYAIRPGDRYFVRGMREELDAPGEWYHDRESKTLLFLPPEPPADRPVTIPTRATILSLGPDAEHVTIRGLTFECCEGTAVAVRKSTHCRIAGCTVRNRAENNYIHHTGVFYKQGVGVSLGGVGNRAAHNLIHDGPRMGILFSGNNLEIEFNHIRHVNLETEDTGAVYTGGRDNRIENNVFIDCGTQQIEYSGWNADHRFWRNHLPTMVKGYESVVGQPAWQSMRNMRLHPKDAVLPDGLIMTGNEFVRNIVDYRDPGAKLFAFRNLPLDHYRSDDNVVWHHGLPLLTGRQKTGKTLATVALDNAGFETGAPGALPDRWRWQVKPADAVAAVVEGDAATGKHALRITAGTGTDAGGKAVSAQVISSDFAIQPGRTYRLSAALRANRPGVKVGLMLQSYVPKAFFWANFPNQATIDTADTAWKPVQFTFRVPAAGEHGHHEQMKAGVVRIDVGEAGADVLVDDVKLEEVEALDEWASWQSLGFDRKSLVADPLFRNRDADDYRLRPESPALKLGFQPIPVEKIGPYADELRASWPIVEAEGAREKPLMR